MSSAEEGKTVKTIEEQKWFGSLATMLTEEISQSDSFGEQLLNVVVMIMNQEKQKYCQG